MGKDLFFKSLSTKAARKAVSDRQPARPTRSRPSKGGNSYMKQMRQKGLTYGSGY